MLPTLFTLFLFFTSILSTNPPPLQTLTLHHLSSSSSTPKPLAILIFSPLYPSSSTIESFTPPPPPSSSQDLTLIALLLPDSKRRTTLVATEALHNGNGRFRITVTEKGEALGAEWVVGAVSQIERTPTHMPTKGDFDLLVVKEAPRVVLETSLLGKAGKPKVVGADGEEQQEFAEKTLLQKYWWVLLGVAVLVMSGGGGDK